MLRRILSALQSSRGRVGLTLSVANYAQAAVGFLVNFYLARWLGAAGYGLFSYGIVLGTVLYTIVNFGAERTLVRDLVQREDKARIMSASIALRGVLACVSLLVVVLIVALTRPEADKSAVVVLCAAAAGFWAVQPVAWFDAGYRMHHHALILLAERTIYAASVITLLATGVVQGAVGVAVLLLGARAVSLAVQLAVVRRSLRFDFSELVPTVGILVRANVFIVAAALANLFISHWNQIYLEKRLSVENLGFYALAFQLVAVVTLLQNQILRLFFPRIAALTADGADPYLAERKMALYAAFGAALSLAVTVPLLVAGPWLIGTVFGPEYLPAVVPLRLLCVWVVFTGAARVVNAFLVNLHQDQTFFWSAVLAGGLAVGLGLVLIPKWGEAGVALALLISHPVSVAAQFVRVRRELGKRKRERGGGVGE